MTEPAQINHITTAFYGMADPDMFYKGIQTALNQVAPQGVFTGDNLFTFGRNLSFLEDSKFMEAFDRHTETVIEKSVIWRSYILS